MRLRLSAVLMAYPAYARATGTGFVIGFGRIGAMLRPDAGGGLVVLGLDRASFAATMAMGPVLAAVAMLTLRGSLVAAPRRHVEG